MSRAEPTVSVDDVAEGGHVAAGDGAVGANEAVDGWRREWQRARRFLRPLDDLHPEPPIPPPLPSGRTIVLPGRGELFVRVSDPVPGTLPILLLHGWTSTADQNWFRCYEALSARRQVVAIDHQGHGRGIRSEEVFTFEQCADDAAGVLRELGIDRAIVAGYSMGGPIALHTARRHPGRVAGLILAATALQASDTGVDKVKWFLLRLGEALPRLTTGQSLVRRTVRQYVEDDPTLTPFRAWLLGDSKRGYLPDVLRAGRALAAHDARPWVHEITVPITVVLTTRDRLVNPAQQRQMARTTGAPVVELDGDHDAFLVRPVTFARAMVNAADLTATAAAGPVIA